MNLVINGLLTHLGSTNDNVKEIVLNSLRKHIGGGGGIEVLRPLSTI